MKKEKFSEGKEPMGHVMSTQQLHAAKKGHHSGSEEHVDGLKRDGHELADSETRKLC